MLDTENREDASPGLASNRMVLPLMCMLAGVLLACGCGSSNLNLARQDFNKGKFDTAESHILQIPEKTNNRVLFLMERGMIRQSQGKYKESASDLVEASRISDNLDVISVSKTSASLLINDKVKTFKGAPYERLLMRVMAANDFMALSMWDDAAVEGRNIIYALENKKEFTDNPFVRYVAGFCFEMIDDFDTASRQYAASSKLMPYLDIDNIGRLSLTAKENKSDESKDNKKAVKKDTYSGSELVCFIYTGSKHSNINVSSNRFPYAKIYSDSKYLGRSYSFANVRKLRKNYQDKIAALTATKTATRIAIKESIANAVDKNNESLGELIRLLLLALEAKDEREWKTLPVWLQVSRVHCPDNLKSFHIDFLAPNGSILSSKEIKAPITHHGKVFVSICRDM